jgi:hypothetical protein
VSRHHGTAGAHAEAVHALTSVAHTATWEGAVAGAAGLGGKWVAASAAAGDDANAACLLQLAAGGGEGESGARWLADVLRPQPAA